MRKHLSKALALALAMSSLASVSLAEGSVLNVWCWNDEFQSRFNAYYPEVKEVAEDKSTTTLNDGTIVKWTINPNADNNYQNKLDEALLAQESAADDDKIDMFLIEADYALKYVDSPYTLDVRADIGLTDDELAGQYKYTQDIATCRRRAQGRDLAGDAGSVRLPPLHRQGCARHGRSRRSADLPERLG